MPVVDTFCAIYRGHVQWKVVNIAVIFHFLPASRRRSTPVIEHWFKKPYCVKSKAMTFGGVTFVVYFQLGIENNRLSRKLTEVIVLRYDVSDGVLVKFEPGDVRRANGVLHE